MAAASTDPAVANPARSRARTVWLALVAACVVALAAPAAANAYVYWVNSGTGSIARANLDGSNVNTKFVPNVNAQGGIALDGKYIYFSMFAAGTIARVNLDGSGVVDTSFIAGADQPEGVAVDGQYVYWTNSGSNTIGRANLDGSGANQSFITGADFPQGVAVDSQHIYWGNAGNDRIGRANLDGTGVNQSLLLGNGAPYGVAVDGQHLYWADYPSGTIGRANLDGTNVEDQYITDQSDDRWVALLGQYLYWTNANHSTVGRAGLQADPGFISGASFPEGIAVDALGPTPPSCRGVQASTTQGTPVTVALSCSDSTGAPLTYATDTPPANGALSALNATTGKVTYTPNASFAGTDTFTYHATSANGTATTATVSIKVSAAGGAPPPPPPPASTTGQPPAISAARLTRARFRVAPGATAVTARAARGTSFRFTLSTQATLEITISHRAAGLRSGRRCVAATPRLRHAHAHACIRTVIDGVLVRAREPAGADAVAFTGRIGKRALKPRSYRARLAATNTAGTSPPVMLTFTLVA